MDRKTPVLDIRLFGPMTVTLRETPLGRLRSRSSSWLLALLALRLGRDVSRDWLAAVIWPESERDLAFYNLRRSLTDLRHALGADADLLETPTRQILRLTSDSVRVDAIEFEQATAQRTGDDLEKALELYRSVLLEGCTEEWAIAERLIYQQRYLAALQKLAARANDSGDFLAAVRYLRLAVAADPLQEATQRALMEALAACGDHAAVTQVFRDLRLHLHRELNARPDPETDTLYQCLVARVKPPSALAAAPIPSSRVSRRLPVPLTTLIGRERDVEEVSGWLGHGRLMTLVGTGGVGKTRLALAVGDALTHHYPDGVWFVELASLTDPNLIPHTIAAMLGIPEKSGFSLRETLSEALESRSLLLILDNCEHLLDECSRLAGNLLAACPGLRLVATSRQPLGILGERAYQVSPLELPDGLSAFKDVAMLLDYSGVRLFVERALMVAPQFRLTRQNAESVLQLCHQLDGIPLAIELAAARLRSLSVEEIVARLSESLSLLNTGNRTALPRHQSLRALMDWSYVLLNEQEQAFLRRLSVFAGGWTLESAEMVAGVGWETCPCDILESLTSLVEKSLVVRVENGGISRYNLLETVRQYSAERLKESREERTARSNHRAYFLTLTEEAVPNLIGPAQSEWLERLAAEHDNLREALAHCYEPNPISPVVEDSGEIALRLASGLTRFWILRGFLDEGRTHLEKALSYVKATPRTTARANALYAIGSLAARQGDTETARNYQWESLEIHRELGNKEGIANALNALGLAASASGDYSTARPFFEESLTLHREAGNTGGVATALNSLGLIAWYQGHYAEAKTFHEESLALKRTLGNRTGIGFSLTNLGLVALAQGDFPAAASLLEESLELRRTLGDRWGVGDTLNYLGITAWHQGDMERARQFHEESLAIQKGLGNKGGIANSLRNLGLILMEQGDYHAARLMMRDSLSINRDIADRLAIARNLEAFVLLAAKTSPPELVARLWGAAQALRAEIEAPLPPNEQEKCNAPVSAVRKALGDDTFDLAFETGRASVATQIHELLN